MEVAGNGRAGKHKWHPRCCSATQYSRCSSMWVFVLCFHFQLAPLVFSSCDSFKSIWMQNRLCCLFLDVVTLIKQRSTVVEPLSPCWIAQTESHWGTVCQTICTCGRFMSWSGDDTHPLHAHHFWNLKCALNNPPELSPSKVPCISSLSFLNWQIIQDEAENTVLQHILHSFVPQSCPRRQTFCLPATWADWWRGSTDVSPAGESLWRHREIPHQVPCRASPGGLPAVHCKTNRGKCGVALYSWGGGVGGGGWRGCYLIFELK